MRKAVKRNQTSHDRLRAAIERLANAEAALAVQREAIARGDRIDRKRYEERVFLWLRSIRDRFLGFSARYAAEVAAEEGRDQFDVAAEIDAEVYEALERWATLIPEPPFGELYARALRPDPIVTVSEWADRYRLLSSRGAAETGPYRVARTPYVREIMDNLSVTSDVRRVIVKKAAQLGLTEAGNCWLGYVIDHAPGPLLAVQPTVEMAKRFSRQRVEPLIADSPRLRERVATPRSKDSANTVLMKEFQGGTLVITGANSAVGLRSMPARYVFADEVDAWPGDVGNEGDPITLAEARTRTFGIRSKIFIVSTPQIKGASAVSREYDRSDQRRYFVPCPHCGEEQTIEFANLRYEKLELSGGKVGIKDRRVELECEHCHKLIGEHYKTEMLAAGKWKATAESTDSKTRGYHLSALYSPVGWLSWATIADQWENEACKSADARKSFVNTVLGLEFEEEASAVPDWQRLYDRRETWPHRVVPMRGLFLTAGVDVQADRLEMDVWAWGRGLESWLVEHIELLGDPGRVEVWNKLTAALSRAWEHSAGKAPLTLHRVAVDTGAFTGDVYTWARVQDRSLVMPIKGVPGFDRSIPVVGPTRVERLPNGTQLKSGLSLWTVSTAFFKRETYRNLELAKPTDEQLATGEHFPPGYVHVPTHVSDEWVKQLVAEQAVVVRTRNRTVRFEWRLLRHRNEALDARIYARAAAWQCGMDRWNDSQWRKLEKQVGIDSPKPAPDKPQKPSTDRPQGPSVPRQPPAPMVPRQFVNNRRIGYARW